MKEQNTWTRPECDCCHHYISKDGTVTLTADLHDSIAGEYIEVLGMVSDGMSIEQFQEELS